jgi:hypothetical protein
MCQKSHKSVKMAPKIEFSGACSTFLLPNAKEMSFWWDRGQISFYFCLSTLPHLHFPIIIRQTRQFLVDYIRHSCMITVRSFPKNKPIFLACQLLDVSVKGTASRCCLLLPRRITLLCAVQYSLIGRYVKLVVAENTPSFDFPHDFSWKTPACFNREAFQILAKQCTSQGIHTPSASMLEYNHLCCRISTGAWSPIPGVRFNDGCSPHLPVSEKSGFLHLWPCPPDSWNYLV